MIVIVNIPKCDNCIVVMQGMPLFLGRYMTCLGIKYHVSNSIEDGSEEGRRGELEGGKEGKRD